jgi:Tfp pilus assembly PilM family ATPase
MTTLSVQSDRSEIDLEEIDREFSKRSAVYKKLAMGVNFSGQNINFAEVERHDDHFSVTKFGTIQTNMKFGTGIEGVEKNIQDLYSYLNGCLEDNAVQAKRLNISLNSHLATIHKIVTDPDSTNEEFESHAKWEFSQRVLDDLDQYIVNTCNLKSSTPSPLEPVLIVGVRRRFVETISKVLDKCKIDLSCVDVDILCAHATYEMNYDPLANRLTALAEVKTGVATILLCRDFDIEDVYQFTFSTKNSPQKIGDLLNHHLEHMMGLYQQNQNDTTPLARVILTNELAKVILPYVDARFSPGTIHPFRKIRLPEALIPRELEENSPVDDKTKSKIKPVEIDYTLFSECVGAGIKLLAEQP